MSIREKIQGIRQEVGQFTREHALLFRRAKIALELGLVLAAPASLIACNEATATEPTAPMTTPLPTDMINPLDAQATGVSTLAPVDGSTQGQQPEVPPTAAPEAVASATPPTMEQLAQGGGFNYESQEELQRNALDYLYNFFFVEQVVNEDGVPGTRFDELGGEISIFPWAGGAWGTSPQLMQTEGQGKPIAYVNFGIKGPARRTSVAGFTEQTGITADSLRFGEDGVVYAVVVHPDGSTTDVGMTSRDIVNWQVLQTAQVPIETPTEEPTATPAPTETPTPEPTAEIIDAAAELARGLEAFAASPVSGQLEMVYSVHPEIRINPEPAKNLYTYFIEVVTTSKGFAPYWQALGLYDHASIMNYLQQNNYRVPTQVGEQFWPTVRFSNDSYIINGQESDWVRGDKRLETIDLSSLGFMLTDNEKMGNSAYADEVKKLYGQGNIGYLASGFSAALRYNNDGLPFIIVKESEEMSGTPDLASLSGKIVDEEYNKLLSMHVATLVRAISTSNPLRPEANNCTVPLAINPMRRGNCVPDDENGVHNMGIEYLGANIHTLNRLGLTGLFTIQP